MKLFAAMFLFAASMFTVSCTGYGWGEYPNLFGGSYYIGYSDGSFPPSNQFRGVRVCNEIGCGEPMIRRRPRVDVEDLE